jgi:pantoate--beta-alanine ligase
VEVARSREEIRRLRASLPGPVGFVPTMGALHAGHRSLLDSARREGASVVASLFVNPTQFGPHEDFRRYPRDEARDLELFAEAGVEAVFVPSVDEMYPNGFSTSVDPGRLAEVLEGARRPGHFRGVATVVTLLFGLVRPDVAYFGQKDGQQTVVLRRVVADLALPVRLAVVPTVRDPDGLALSSRNVYLSPDERAAAPVLHRALQAALQAYAAGERDADELRDRMRRTVAAEPLGDLEYVSVADGETLAELERVDRKGLASLAVRFGRTRLIDCAPLGA